MAPMKSASLVLMALLLLARATAAPIEHDLGLGLEYWRAHSIPDELPPAAPAAHSWVLDLRYATGGPRAAADLLGWLKAHSGPHTPVFLLANMKTSESLLAPLDSADAVIGLIIIGAGAPDFDPDIPVKETPAADRHAYDALEKGEPIEALLYRNRDKPRDDEARLEREHISDSDDDNGPPAPPVKPQPMNDPVLQKALHLHRALLALNRL
jgi:hypothetical protein